MPRFSDVELHAFVASSEFEKFYARLNEHRCLTIQQATESWPVGNAGLRERNQRVSRLLREIASRSSSQVNNPNFVSASSEGIRFTFSREIALLPDGIIGSKPIDVLRTGDSQIDYSSLAASLVARLPEFGVVRELTVFCAEPIPREEGIAFSGENAVLDRYSFRLREHKEVKVGRSELKTLLAKHDFLESWNMALFFTAIRDRIPGSVSWRTEVDVHPADATFTSPVGETLRALFLGTRSSERLKDLISTVASTSHPTMLW